MNSTATVSLPLITSLRRVGFSLLLGLFALPASATGFGEWAIHNRLFGGQGLPLADPDGDFYVNALEYAFGSDPNVPETTPIGPTLTVEDSLAILTYRVSDQAYGVAQYRVIESATLDEVGAGREVDSTPYLQSVESGYSVYSQQFDRIDTHHFYRLAVTVPLLGTDPNTITIVVGTGIGGGYWEGLPSLATGNIRLQPPNVSESVAIPNRTKYPEVVGSSQVAVTEDLLDTLTQTGRRLPRRSWMGWFLWAKGTPPPGLSPGYPVTGNYDPTQGWDFFSYQFPAKGTNEPPPGQSWPGLHGQWKPIRLDQQPLYANPFRVNYAWPPGSFGYQSQPLKEFEQQTGYWADKRIVRGPNLSFPSPFFVQYGDRVSTGDTPDEWRDSWFYQRTRPLETLLLVPSNLKPDDLLQAGPWNSTGTAGLNDPFPYPVWDVNAPARDQTPFAILVDRMGDWDADLIWEGTHPGASGYETNRYRRTPFNQAGQGNYLKMTVAQGSPFIWCETHHNRYQIFYNLIRQNLTNRIASNEGTDAKVVPGGPWLVPGVSDVSYVLLYGDHNNPNQWYHEMSPSFYDMPTGQPGGFNPPGSQHNHTYIALFYRTSTVQPVTLGTGGSNGTDAQGNPYFLLEFKSAAKNWFVVGAVPVMSYYHTGVPVDSEASRIAGARDWAEQMGQYAFNFLIDTRISYAAENMTTVSTTFANQVRNPFVASGDPSASTLTANSTATVMALSPHQYQPLTLGPDLTQAARPQVVWNPLRQYGADFPVPASAPPNANRNDPNSSSRWGYWGPRGTMKTIITESFVVQYPFQNFLPVLPPPNLKTNYVQTGIQAVRITDVGTGNRRIENPVPAATLHTASPANGSGAAFQVLLEPNTGQVMQVNVTSPGSGYPDGNPPDVSKVWLTVDPPQIPAANGGRPALARLQIGGGKVLAVFMDDKGAGYESTISVTQNGVQTDPPIIQPVFDAAGNLVPGLANIISGGAGFDFSNPGNPPVVKLLGTGSGATAQIVGPGEIVKIAPSPVGGFAAAGLYPSTGNDAEDFTRIVAELPPPAPGVPAQRVAVTGVGRVPTFFVAMLDQGQYVTQPAASVVDDSGAAIPLDLNFGGGRVINVFRSASGAVPTVTTPKEVVFDGGDPIRPARALIYGAVSVRSVSLDGPLVGGYSGSAVISFRGGNVLPAGVTLPELSYSFNQDGTLNTGSVRITQPGTGWTYGGNIKIVGGKGFDAAVSPLLGSAGEFLGVKVLRGGNNYPTNVYAHISGGNTAQAKLNVIVQNGSITAVDVVEPGSGYSGPVVAFTSSPTGDEVNQPAKGEFAEILFGVTLEGGITGLNIIKTGSGYLPGTEAAATPDSPRSHLRFDGPTPMATSSGQAAGYIADVVKPDISVEQVLYDNLITEYTTLGTREQRPFGGSFGGKGGPDGYGLGNALAATAKLTGILYNFQQHFAAEGRDQPDVEPSFFAFNAANTPASAYELPIYKEHHLALTLSGALQTSVQALQRTLSLFHQDPPYANSPDPSDWTMQYFSQYDVGAGRVVIHPSGSIPVQGVVSSIADPPAVPPEENLGKEGLKQWQPGMLWSGFGVSDQWNDQHYFFGYYLGTAGLMSIFDHSWEDSLPGKPPLVWSDASQLGTGVDQWLMTLAYDPDNPSLASALHQRTGMTYQKFAFFDQWSGHGWATGISPGRAGDVEDGQFGAHVPWSVWLSHGTGSGPYDDENENSIWEGLQAWSAILLWGGGTDRKPVVDLGMYLLATGNAAGDLYFHDKNYNLSGSASNRFSWVPVTTVNSAEVRQNGGNNNTPANTGFVETANPAFYTAPEAWGGVGSSGTSILHKGSPSLNNFFYAFPTGSKFIQSFPPAPWTLGMSRNTDYMRRWAGSMMRQEWKNARESSLYQPANWLSMAMACAVSGVPYNPGDIPFPLAGTDPVPNAPAPYVERLWSSWVTLNSAAGSQAALQPAFRPLEILTFLHTFAEYGTADWTYISRATDSSGQPDNDSIVFTATFSKVINPATVRTTFVAFNPGWTTRYASFHRLGIDGSIGSSPVLSDFPLSVGAKRLRLLSHDFPVR